MFLYQYKGTWPIVCCSCLVLVFLFWMNFKYGNRKSTFTQHLIDNWHNIRRMDDIMYTVHITSKGKMINILEKYYIFCKTKLNNQINDKVTIKQNIMFDTVVCYNHHRWLPDAYTQSRQQPVSVTQDHHSYSQWYKLVLNDICQAIHPHHQGLQTPIKCYETIIYSSKYKTEYSTHPYASK